MALMVNDLGISDLEEAKMARMDGEVRSLPYPVDAEVLDRVLACVREPERLSGAEGGFTGAPDTSHEPRPDE